MEVFGSMENSPKFLCKVCNVICIGDTEYMNHMSNHNSKSVSRGSNGSNEKLIYMAWAEQPGLTPFDTFTSAR